MAFSQEIITFQPARGRGEIWYSVAALAVNGVEGYGKLTVRNSAPDAQKYLGLDVLASPQKILVPVGIYDANGDHLERTVDYGQLIVRTSWGAPSGAEDVTNYANTHMRTVTAVARELQQLLHQPYSQK
jgi:hypothetical protein